MTNGLKKVLLSLEEKNPRFAANYLMESLGDG
jgi:hypothetical protein